MNRNSLFILLFFCCLSTNNIFAQRITVTIDKSKDVGSIPYTSNVTPTGAVTYNVPIEVYPGFRNIQPQLSVVYNSQSGNGIMGTGWNLSGISSITRAPKCWYYDGQASSINLNKDDAFYLDGIRLIKLSETATQIKYETEQGNIKVNAVVNGNIICYFVVYFPNSTVGTFGMSDNTSANYLEYPISNFRDGYFNSITYSYVYSDNHYKIDKITYNNNATVNFSYSSRTDALNYYQAGLNITETQLLQKIDVKLGTCLLRTYEFVYNLSADVNLLEKINYSAAGHSLNPLVFYYGEGFSRETTYSQLNFSLSKYFPTSSEDIRICNGAIGNAKAKINEGLVFVQNKNPYLFESSDRNSYVWYENQYNGSEKI